jgi:hypothetical protein
VISYIIVDRQKKLRRRVVRLPMIFGN